MCFPHSSKLLLRNDRLYLPKLDEDKLSRVQFTAGFHDKRLLFSLGKIWGGMIYFPNFIARLEKIA